jgi:hypothetical protein
MDGTMIFLFTVLAVLGCFVLVFAISFSGDSTRETFSEDQVTKMFEALGNVQNSLDDIEINQRSNLGIIRAMLNKSDADHTTYFKEE